ncbi:hypothetical protein [Pontibacter sp. BAB1700]|uniref:hypothetical protein n=1 Tax=Pontibacter sp. BAB1700 TaxID=1144253 RepID=UPI00026BE435|nr:hypothetical protein [Pontibacter sp. BAB1700]EJF08893.1 hypothetical protein O71_18296 [Pontibacter sp. BAB1700]
MKRTEIITSSFAMQKGVKIKGKELKVLKRAMLKEKEFQFYLCSESNHPDDKISISYYFLEGDRRGESIIFQNNYVKRELTEFETYWQNQAFLYQLSVAKTIYYIEGTGLFAFTVDTTDIHSKAESIKKSLTFSCIYNSPLTRTYKITSLLAATPLATSDRSLN